MDNNEQHERHLAIHQKLVRQFRREEMRFESQLLSRSLWAVIIAWFRARRSA